MEGKLLVSALTQNEAQKVTIRVDGRECDIAQIVLVPTKIYGRYDVSLVTALEADDDGE